MNTVLVDGRSISVPNCRLEGLAASPVNWSDGRLLKAASFAAYTGCCDEPPLDALFPDALKSFHCEIVLLCVIPKSDRSQSTQPDKSIGLKRFALPEAAIRVPDIR